MEMIHPNQYFDKIFCINLDRRKDRWESVSERFRHLDLWVRRVSAVDATGTKLSANGALKETVKIIAQSLPTDFSRVLILEDDVLFHKDFLKLFDEQVSKVPKYNNWFLGCMGELDKKAIVNDHFCIGRYVYGTHAVAYDVRFLKSFVKEFDNPQHKKWPIDCILSERIVECDTWASVNPCLCVQDESASDISESKRGAWRQYDKSIYE